MEIFYLTFLRRDKIMIKDRNLALKRQAFLKKEAIKAMTACGTYKGPEKDIIDFAKSSPSPKKGKLKTEIKMTSSKLKNVFADNNDLAKDLGLDQIFNDVPAEEQKSDEIDTSAIDRIYQELESGEEPAANAGECQCPCCQDKNAPEDGSLDDMTVEGGEELPVTKGEAADELEVAGTEENDFENEQRIMKVAKRIRNYKVHQNINSEDVDEIEKAADEASSPNVQKRLLRLVKRIKGSGYEKSVKLRNENEVADIDSTDIEISSDMQNKLNNVANALRSLKSELQAEEDAGAPDMLEDENNEDEKADEIKAQEPDSDDDIISSLSSLNEEQIDIDVDGKENIDETINSIFSEMDAEEDINIDINDEAPKKLCNEEQIDIDVDNKASMECGGMKKMAVEDEKINIDVEESEGTEVSLANLFEDLPAEDPQDEPEVELNSLFAEISEDEAINIDTDDAMV